MKLSVSQKISYGIGAFGKDVVYMMITSYLLYYYNVVLSMDSVFIGTVMMIARIFDAINDPFMGIVVAKTKTRWGRFRPWILTGTVLNAVTIYALFATPDADPNSSVMKIWLTVFYFAWGITYTLMDIPFWSMIPAITKSGKDREELTAIGRSCAGIGEAVPAILTMAIVPILGAGTSMANYKIGFEYWAIIIAVVFVISELIMVFNVKEPKIDINMPTTKVGDMFKSLFKNDQAMCIVVSIICVYAALNICTNLVLYFFQFDVGNKEAYSLFAAVAFLAQIIIMMVIPSLRKKFSKNQLFLTGFIVQIFGFALILVIAFSGFYSSDMWYSLFIPGVLIYMGFGMLTVIMTVFLSDSIDYGEVKNGTRDESIIFSMQTFTVKLASGIAIFFVGLIVSWIGLDTSEGAINSIDTLNGLRLWMTVPCIVLLIVGMVIYKKFYKLDDAKMKEINSRLS